MVGVDSSPEMIAAAPGERSAAEPAPNLSFALGDVWDWRPERPLDVLVCNAVLQWVPGHDELLLRWADLLAPGGWLAFQLPGNFDQPSHAIVREMAASPRWRGLLADARLNRQAGDPADYVALLARPGFEVDAWETSYLHILHGENPVLEWTKGTTLRPVLAALDAEQARRLRRRVRRTADGGVSPAVRSEPSFPSAGCSRSCTARTSAAADRLFARSAEGLRARPQLEI